MTLGHLPSLSDGGPHISHKQGNSLSRIGLVPLTNFPPALKYEGDHFLLLI